MTLVLFAVIGADQTRVTYDTVAPLDVRQDFTVSFQAGPNESIGLDTVSRFYNLPWVRAVDYNSHVASLEAVYDELVMADIQTWAELVDAVNLAFTGGS